MKKNTKKMLEILSKRKERSEKALNNVRKEVRVIPQIEEVKRLTDWQIKAIQNVPDEFDIPGEMLTIVENESQLFAQVYGQLFEKEVKINTDHSPVVSGSSCALAYYHDVSQQDKYKEAKMTWAEENITDYLAISKEMNRQKSTEDLIRRIDPKIADEFRSGVEDLAKSKAEVIPIIDLALRYRTIMEKVKGVLNVRLLLPKIQVKENKILEELANHFTGSTVGSDYHLFYTEISNYKDIHLKLTDIGKRNKDISISDFEVLAVRFVDNLYAILSTLARNAKGAF